MLSAYFSPPLRALLFSVLKALAILAVLVGAIWWWWRSSHSKQTSKSILGVEIAATGATDAMGRSLTSLDHAWLEASTPNAPAPPTRFDRALLDRIEWKRLEEVCAEYFRLIGLVARTQACGADGGIDIWLAAPDAPDKTTKIVQCKSLNSPVGIKLMREFLGVMTAGEYWRPSCPSCGNKLVKRERGSDGNPFWGCENFPRPCSYRGMSMAE